MRFLLLTLFLLPAGLMRADGFESARLSNWHRWRGPEANGVAPEADPPVEWDTEKNVRWKTPIPGKGSATPIVWKDRVFVVTAIETDRKGEASAGPQTPVRLVSQVAQVEPPPRRERPPRQRGGFGFGRSPAPENVYQFVVMCLDRATGDVLWQKTAVEAVPHEGTHQTGTFASCSPVTDGENLFVSFGSQGIYAYTLDGEPLWDRDLGDMSIRARFGEGASPALHGNTLVVPWDHEGQSKLFALNARTGKTLWEIHRDESTTWCTPLVVEHEGTTQVVMNGSPTSMSYDLKSGELLWEAGGQVRNPISTPVARDGVVYCMTGRQGFALTAIPLGGRGDVTDQILWSTDQATSYVPSPLLYGDRLYFCKSMNGILTCLDAATGEPRFTEERVPGVRTVYASPLGAAGRVYLCSREGVTTVIRDADELEVLSENDLGETIDASPVAVGKELFIRTETALYCIAE